MRETRGAAYGDDMTMQTDRDLESSDSQDHPRRATPPPAGGAVYGLGLLGALVWFWREASGVRGHLMAVVKALVWPAILVHDAFKALRG